MENILTLLKADRHSLNFLDPNITTKAKDKYGENASKYLVMFFVAAMMIAIGFFSYVIADSLKTEGYTYVMLALMIAVSLILTLMNSIYKSQGMLFVSKDNDLLLSLPLTKKEILFSRIVKLMASQYVWTFLVLVPAVAVYIHFEGFTIDLLVASIVMMLALPIIPVILGTIIGFIVTFVSSRFKNKNMVQIIASIISFIVTFYISFNLMSGIENLANNAEDIYEFLKKLYYPLGLYIECVENFDGIKLLKIVVINLVPLIMFVYIFNFGYYNIISKLSENHAKSKYLLKKAKCSSVLGTLLKKEAKKYFRSSIYLLNTIISPLMLVVIAFFLVLKGYSLDSLIGMEDITPQMIESLKNMLPVYIFMIISFTVSTANISASSISLEGKMIAILRSLPLYVSDIFLAKVLFHFLVIFIPSSVAVVLICITQSISLIDTVILLISLASIVALFALLGLVINILLPKMDGNDISIVKQSASSICSMISGIVYTICIWYLMYKQVFDTPIMLVGVVSGINIVLATALWYFLETYGIKKFDML